jgi:PAS domain S-box-containing protein
MKTAEITAQASLSKSIPKPPLLVWALLFVSLSITFFIWQLLNKEVDKVAKVDFQHHAEKIRESVHQRMLAYEQVLRGGVGIFNATNEVSRSEWKAYIESLSLAQSYPGIQGTGFSKHLWPNELSHHIKQIRAQGFPDYTVKPAGPRDEYTAIIYLEPFNERNKRAFGFDMFSQETRHAAMVQARDSGQPTISGKVILKQETNADVQAGFLMYLPVYRTNASINTLNQRKQALIGYVYSAFRMNDLINDTANINDSIPSVDLEIYDGLDISKDTLMYDDAHIIDARNTHSLRLFSEIQPLIVTNHIWTLATTSTPAFEAQIDRSKPLITAIAGTLISFLFFIVTWSMATHRIRAQNLAKQMLSALNEQEGLTKAILEEAADGIITINKTGNILSFNTAAERIFGYTLAEVMHKNIKMLMPEPYHSAHDGYLVNYLTSGHKKIIGIGREVTGLRKNGEIFAMDLAVSEVNTGNDEHLFAGIVRDISERKEAEMKLRRSEERFDLAISGSNAGLWDWDIVNKASYHSPRWNAMFGYAEIETTVPSGDWLNHIHPDDKERVKLEVNMYLDERNERYQSEFRMQHKDGHFVWILSRGIAQYDETGKPIRMVGIYTDISQQKHIENMKSEFVSTVSHELRTPLTAIRGSLGLVTGGVTGVLPEQAKGMLDLAYKNTTRLLTLINDILDIDKIQSGKMDFTLKSQALMPLIEQSLSCNAGYAEQYQVKFQLVSGLPSVWVNVDGDRLIQVMSNLLSNAAKFSHTGGTIDVTVTHHAKGVRVAVSDHGLGISEAFYDKIFKKFTQVDSSDTRHKGGTGLGLNISKAIIEMMDGSIGFESEMGVGTTFYFVLPLATQHN